MTVRLWVDRNALETDGPAIVWDDGQHEIMFYEYDLPPGCRVVHYTEAYRSTSGQRIRCAIELPDG